MTNQGGHMKGRARRSGVAAAFAVAGLAAIAVLAAGATPSASGKAARPAAKLAKDCKLEHGAKHVVYLIFDNVHFLRDNPNVPSDVEQMPHLLNFIRNNGTMMTNDHTVLISHTANGILTNLTGMYSDRHGQSVSNSYRYFKPDGTTLSSSSFKYWTDLVDDTNAT